ncbi:MAG: succinate--CoA ligase subunit beta, partial [Nitrospira sp.]|nr:succinate--CoA ligase subunit beta [Nitrospira sp.]
MKIHEYQGKELFRKYNVPVPNGVVIDDAKDAAKAAEKLGTKVTVVKAQI